MPSSELCEFPIAVGVPLDETQLNHTSTNTCTMYLQNLGRE